MAFKKMAKLMNLDNKIKGNMGKDNFLKFKMAVLIIQSCKANVGAIPNIFNL